jgi:hypothetical protein
VNTHETVAFPARAGSSPDGGSNGARPFFPPVPALVAMLRPSAAASPCRETPRRICALAFVPPVAAEVLSSVDESRVSMKINRAVHSA